MNIAMTSTLKLLEDRKVRGRDYAFSAGAVRATIDASFCEPKEAGSFIDGIEHLIEKGKLIKNDKTAIVARVLWKGQELAVKRYNQRGLFHSMRHTIKGSRAGRAWLYGHLLNNIGVRSPQPLACIEVTQGGMLRRSYIVTPYIDGPHLHRFIAESTNSDRLRQAMETIDDMMALMASHNVSHGDMKHTNVIISADGPVLTDLDSVVAHRLGLACRRQYGLDKARFMRDCDSSDVPSWVRVLASAAMGLHESDPNTYDIAEEAGWRLLIRRGFRHEDALAIIKGGKLCADGRFRRGQSSDSARVFLYDCQYDGRRRTVYVKDCPHRSRIDALKHMLRPSRARRAFDANLMLRNNRIGSPEPLVLLEKRVRLFCSAAAVVTEGIENAISPSEHMRQLRTSRTPAAVSAHRRLLHQLGRTVGRMHTHGIFHGDLRLDNILIQHGESGTRLYFIDNERTRQFSLLPLRLRLKNLVQLNMTDHGLTSTDRLRFFSSYVEASGLSRYEQRALVARVVTWTMRRLRIREEHHRAD